MIAGARAMRLAAARSRLARPTAAPCARSLARHAARGAVLALALAGCDAPVELAASRAAIVGGAPAPGAPAVVAIVAVVPTCGEPSAPPAVVCTGALIAPRVVLTAAHCVQSDANAQVLAVVLGDDVAAPAAQLRVVAGRVAPAWTAGAHDLGVLVLAADAPVAPLALADAPPAVDALVDVVGFGLDDRGAVGARRGGTARITAVADGSFTIAAAPAMSCGGDSGGPVLAGDRIVGVTSFGDPACTTGVNMRVDADAAFLAAAVADAPPRPAFDPTVDACAAPCRDHADCPIGMACTAGPGATATCAVAGFPAGHFGAACTGPAGAVPCLAQPDATAACRLWRPCDAPGPGGCAVAGDASWLTALVAVFGALGAVARPRRPRGAQSNQ